VTRELPRGTSIDEVGGGVWRLVVDRYQSTFVVGDDASLLIDTQDRSRAQRMYELTTIVTDRPLRAVAFTHHHMDHAGGVDALRAAAAAHTGDEEAAVAIIGTEECARAIDRHGNRVPQPTVRLPDGGGTFDFHGRSIRHGSARGHCPDNTWFLAEDAGVLHCVDMIHPGGLEFEAFGLAQDMVEYETSLKLLLTLDWRVLVAGHAALGTPDDVRLLLRYIADVRTALDEAGRSMAGAPVLTAAPGPRRDALVAAAVELLRPVWGDYPTFDAVAWSHVNALYWHVVYFD
jgi:glyoxylase-like metal-dependent hydrolase (beta-lactamase superfamily II)